MIYLKEWLRFNPKLNKEVVDFVNDHKYSLTNLWDDNLSEIDNINNMIEYFTKYPDEMRSVLNGDKLVSYSKTTGSITPSFIQ